MRKTPLATYLWPGLPQCWVDGSWAGWLLAAAFALLIDGLIIGTWIWTEAAPGAWIEAGWLAAGGLWCVSLAVSSWRRRPAVAESAARSAEDLFRVAQTEYLRGNWCEAQSHLDHLLECSPQDVESRLMLASLLRHTKRYKEARAALARLERFERSADWSREIEAEWRLIDALEKSPAQALVDELTQADSAAAQAA